jgi:DNA-binding NtrC family response regulator
MKILIVENEVYLAQSINAKLTEYGHNCEIANSNKEALKDEYYDLVLLSTNVNSQDFDPVISMHKHSIIILMISYISNDTVTKPINKGANDYILKPFMLEELIRKIDHFQEFEHLKNQNIAYENYLNTIFLTNQHDLSTYTLSSLPLIISSTQPRVSDGFAYQLGQKLNKPFTYISLEDSNAFSLIKQTSKKNLIYLSDYQVLRRNQRDMLHKLIIGNYVILSTTKTIDSDDIDIPIVKLNNDNTLFDEGEIMAIKDYVKYIVVLHQDKLPDTELSKKLGISRKSLWEKRKKYGLIKQK